MKICRFRLGLVFVFVVLVLSGVVMGQIPTDKIYKGSVVDTEYERGNLFGFADNKEVVFTNVDLDPIYFADNKNNFDRGGVFYVKQGLEEGKTGKVKIGDQEFEGLKEGSYIIVKDKKIEKVVIENLEISNTKKIKVVVEDKVVKFEGGDFDFDVKEDDEDIEYQIGNKKIKLPKGSHVEFDDESIVVDFKNVEDEASINVGVDLDVDEDNELEFIVNEDDVDVYFNN
ncbi:hypothetical protein CMI42_02305 [Candidatus Pacearchaeota archaeon]|nr:hypothetical protein [Candidatus Pacearchaeota archaeon]